MDSALGWIGQIAAWLRQFIPKWIVIPTTHGGVKWVKGKRLVHLTPGIHWYWPVVTLLQTYPIVRQSVDLRPQVMVSADTKTFSAGVVVTYTVDDLTQLLSTTFDPDEVMSEISLAAIYSVLTTMTLEELQTNDISTALTDAIQDLVKPYGVHVVRAALTEMAPCRVVKLIVPPTQQPLVTQ